MSKYEHGSEELTEGQARYYTPTTGEVRHRYCDDTEAEYRQDDEAEFDRWLAGVKAEAWEEGNLAEDIGPSMRASNPYREAMCVEGENK